ncbi:MAG: arginine repressor [Eubacteriales bacterium]|nr:arginine repressor [Lachnospiraceae bacterium]MDO5126540.1 arginine repressor [Eubacteriales bacterium]
MKQARQRAIVQLIHEHAIETQEDLLEKLKAQGFNTTQATVSRDIRELDVRKITYDKNKHKYVIGQEQQSITHGSYRQVLESSITSIEGAENLIVVKTVSGMAMAVGAAIDSLKLDGIVGCIAGDDTLFLAVKRTCMTETIIGEIKHVTKFAY